MSMKFELQRSGDLSGLCSKYKPRDVGESKYMTFPEDTPTPLPFFCPSTSVMKHDKYLLSPFQSELILMKKSKHL